MSRMLVLLACLTLPASAWAQSLGIDVSASGDVKVKSSADEASVKPQTPEAEVEMPATLSGRLARGYQLYGIGDFPGAQAAFEAARDIEPKNLTIQYLIGCAQARKGDLDAASQAFKGIQVVATEGDRAIQAKALFMLAVVAETRFDLEGAKQAWLAYQAFINANSAVPSFPDSARNRLEAIGRKQTLDEQYQPVVQKINSANKKDETPAATP